MPRASKIRVVLCDDADAFRALVRMTLADDPSIEVVGEAADGEACVAAVADLQPDVVLLDLSMPGCDGLQAIPLVRREAPRTSIVALSSFGAERMSGTVLERGAVAYLQKGGELSQIAAAIHDAAGVLAASPHS